MGTFFYMLLAFVVGVLVGWFLWGRLRGELDSLRGDLDRTRSERDRLRADLDACSRARTDLEGRLASTAKAAPDKPAAAAPAAVMSTPAAAKSPPAAPTAASKPATAKSATQKAAPKKAAAAPAAKAPAAPKPAAGKGDNLRRLIGIGPVNEKLLKGQGVTTYAQIAAWTQADIERIEHALQFGGRVEREHWVEQAKLLAAGDEAEFARRFPTAGSASNT